MLLTNKVRIVSEAQKQNDLIGKKFNRLTIIGEAPYKVFPTGRKTQVEAICECGDVRIYVLASLKNGNTKSCGCYNRDKITTHGMNETRQYQTWADMKTRCDNVKHKWYPEYGGRGIFYDPKWVKFESFWEDMAEGYADNLTLDRIDNDGPYCKENCRWTDSYTQGHNQRKARNSKSKYIGVIVSGKYINSRIKLRSKNVHLGTYESEELAAKAYDDASQIIFGDRPNKTEDVKDWISEKVSVRIEGVINGMSFTAKGSSSGTAKLTDEQALEVYRLAHEGNIKQKDLAKMFGINQTTVSSIKRGDSWAHVTKHEK